MRNASPTLRTVVAAITGLTLLAVAGHAFADCDDDQTNVAGKAVAAAASAKINSLVPGAGKQMISLDTCDAAGATATTEFKLNVIGSDGLYWVSGKAKVVGKAVQDMKITSVSPNLAAASGKAGVKLLG